MSSLQTCTSSTRPSSPTNGQVLFETDTNKIIIYDLSATAWSVYNADGITYLSGGADELHYTGGIYDDTGATYYIGTTPEIHFDAAFLDGQDSANNPSNGSAVSSWSNRSGSSTSYTATQATASAQPTFTTIGDGSKPCVTFDGGDFLDTANNYALSSDLTLITVSKSTNAAKSAVLGWNGAWQNTIWLKASFNSSDYVTGGSRGDLTAPENFAFHTVTRASGTAKLYENGGTALWSGSNTSTMNAGRIGRNQLDYHSGNISEILVFNSALSTANLNTIRAYVSNKYGITTTSF